MVHGLISSKCSINILIPWFFLLIVIWESEKRVNLLCRILSLFCGNNGKNWTKWENRLEFPDELSVKAYLYSTVRNKALNVLKHRKIEQHYMNEILQDEDAELYYMRSVIEEETRRLIFTAIDSLPEHCRKVCLLNLEGMDNQKIADELQVSLNTVKFHKKNAYKLLRDKLKDQFYLLFLI